MSHYANLLHFDNALPVAVFYHTFLGKFLYYWIDFWIYFVGVVGLQVMAYKKIWQQMILDFCFVSILFYLKQPVLYLIFLWCLVPFRIYLCCNVIFSGLPPPQKNAYLVLISLRLEGWIFAIIIPRLSFEFTLSQFISGSTAQLVWCGNSRLSYLLVNSRYYFVVS